MTSPSSAVPSPLPTIVEGFQHSVRTWPDSIALDAESGSMTYKELSTRVNHLASNIRLSTQGQGPVAIVIGRSVELITAMLAALTAGFAYTALDPAWSAELRGRILDDLQPSLILTATPIDDESVPQMLVNHSSVTTSEALDSEAVDSEAILPATTDLACIFFTSGTSGTPKGVMSTHQAVMRLFEPIGPVSTVGPVLTVGPGRSTAVAAAVSWDALSLEIWSMLTTGGTCIVVEESVLTPTKLRSMIASNGLTTLWITASVFNMIVDLDVDAFLGCDEVLTGGERLSVPHIRRFLHRHPGIRLINGYGPVEATVFVTTHQIVAADLDRPGGIPIGRVVGGTTLYVVDANGFEVKNGTVGELLIGDIATSPGYLGLPELNAQKFANHSCTDGSVDRIYRTGDFVVRSEDGVFEFRGRADREVKVRGVRVDLDELESLVRGIDGVTAAAVVAVQSKGSSESVDRLRLFVSGAATSEVIRKHLLSGLPPGAVPKTIDVLSSLPLLSNGKLDRKSLEGFPEIRSTSNQESKAYSRALTATEQRLQAVWVRVLELDEVGVTENYYDDLGGDSLRAVELLTVIHDEWGVSLPLSALATSPTIESFASVLDNSDAWSNSFEVLVPFRTTGSAIPLFCVHGGSGNVASFPKLLRRLPVEQPFYAFQWDGLDGSRGTTGVQKLAALYVTQLQAVYPVGPIRLAGQCVGGLIALEMVHQLLSSKRDVELLVMFDSPNLFSPEFTDGRRRALAYTLLKMPVGERIRRSRRVVRRWVGYARGRVERQYGGEHAATTMSRSVWRYPPTLPAVKTVLFASGETIANKIGLAGSWSDTAFGWERDRGPLFDIRAVPGGHSDLLYSPETVEILCQLLSDADHSKGGKR